MKIRGNVYPVGFGTPELKPVPDIEFSRTAMFNADHTSLMFDMEVVAVLYAKNAGFKTVRRGDRIVACREDVKGEYYLKPVGKKFVWEER